MYDPVRADEARYQREESARAEREEGIEALAAEIENDTIQRRGLLEDLLGQDEHAVSLVDAIVRGHPEQDEYLDLMRRLVQVKCLSEAERQWDAARKE